MMSVHIPIYKRILYDAPDSNDIQCDIQQHHQTSVQDMEVIPINDKQDMEPAIRQTRSAPSQIIGPTDELQKRPTSSRTLCSAPSLSLTKLSINNQSGRWREHGHNLNQSRTLKRTSNIIAHRQDMGYFISGSKVPLKNKYDIDEEELIRLRMLAHSRAERSTRSTTRNSSAALRKFSPVASPGGQTCSPVPPRSTGLDKMSREEERRKEQQRKKEEREKRLEEKERFEKEMEEKYKPKKPVQKSMIFITENSENDKGIRTFLTDGDFMGNEEGRVYSLINENQRNAFTSIFNNMDKNHDGQVDMDELKQNLSSLISKKNLNHFLQVFDLNKDHTVDAREFVTICALNDALCGIKTESETASLALDLERLAKHITIYKELFSVVDEDGDGRVQPDEVLLLVMTALEGENTQDTSKANGSKQDGNTTNSDSQQKDIDIGGNAQIAITQNGSAQNENTQNGENTKGGDTQEITQAYDTRENKINPIDQEEARRVLESIEKDENGFIDFVSFLSYTPFFAQLLKVILDSPLSISRLEKTRDAVTRKLSKNTT